MAYSSVNSTFYFYLCLCVSCIDLLYYLSINISCGNTTSTMKMQVKPCEHMQCNTYDRGLVLTVVITFTTAMERHDDDKCGNIS